MKCMYMSAIKKSGRVENSRSLVSQMNIILFRHYWVTDYLALLRGIEVGDLSPRILQSDWRKEHSRNSSSTSRRHIWQCLKDYYCCLPCASST